MARFKSAAELTDIEELRLDLLGLESRVRHMQGRYENRYARAHLKEIGLKLSGSLIQLDYAGLALEDVERGAPISAER